MDLGKTPWRHSKTTGHIQKVKKYTLCFFHSFSQPQSGMESGSSCTIILHSGLVWACHCPSANQGSVCTPWQQQRKRTEKSCRHPVHPSIPGALFYISYLCSRRGPGWTAWQTGIQRYCWLTSQRRSAAAAGVVGGCC